MSNTSLGVDCCGDRYEVLTTRSCKCGCGLCYCETCYEEHMAKKGQKCCGHKQQIAALSAQVKEMTRERDEALHRFRVADADRTDLLRDLAASQAALREARDLLVWAGGLVKSLRMIYGELHGPERWQEEQARWLALPAVRALEETGA